MATSGSVDFTLTRDQIIHRALRICGAIETGETASTEEVNDAQIALNAMLKHWQGHGVKLWKKAEGVVHLAVGQTSYTLGTGSTDHVTLLSDAKKTEMAVAGSATDLTITVDSDDDIANADVIGIVLDDGTVHWTTVNGAPAANVVTITAGLASAAAVDNHVYSYTTLINRPLKVIDARRRDDADQDVPVIMFSREEYFQTPNKTTQSKVVQVYYDPQLGTGTLYTWPAPESADDRIIFTCFLPIEDFDAGSDTPDFPQEWFQALCYNLAVDVGFEEGVTPQIQNRIMLRAEKLLREVQAWDDEEASVLFQPDYSPGGEACCRKFRSRRAPPSRAPFLMRHSGR